MRTFGKLIIVEFIALAALLIVAVMTACCLGLASPHAGSAEFVTVLVYTLGIGFLPVVVFGAPAYVFLAHYGQVTWISVVSIGGAPGLLTLLCVSLWGLPPLLGFLGIVCGAAVAAMTHLFYQRLNLGNRCKSNAWRGAV